jgi:hypothetical protein
MRTNNVRIFYVLLREHRFENGKIGVIMNEI